MCFPLTPRYGGVSFQKPPTEGALQGPTQGVVPVPKVTKGLRGPVVWTEDNRTRVLGLLTESGALLRADRDRGRDHALCFGAYGRGTAV